MLEGEIGRGAAVPEGEKEECCVAGSGFGRECISTLAINDLKRDRSRKEQPLGSIMYFENVLFQSRILYIPITRIQETFLRSGIGEKGLILRRNGFQNGPSYASYEDGIRGGFIITVLK